MSFINKLLLPAGIACIFFTINVQASNKANTKEIKNIEAVIEAFRVSLINKDKPVFIDLFYNDSVPWLGTVSDETMANTPPPPPKEDRRKRGKVNGGNYLSFIDWIVKTPKEIEEKFWDVKIINDEDIASVHFKYSFHQDDKKTNWGDEAWHLVRTEQGWKIASVIYSINTKGK